MGVIESLARGARRAEEKAERLRYKSGGSIRRVQRIRRLEAKAALNRKILNDWDDERWG